MDIRIHNGPVDISEAEERYHKSALHRLDHMLESLIKDNQLQCASYMLSRDGRTFANKAMGPLRQDNEGVPFRHDSIRRIASITKMFTVVCILRLMEEGKFHLRQPVKSWIKELDHPTYDKITIYHLLTHTSGLHPDPGYFQEPYPTGWWEYEFAFDEYDEDGQIKQLPPEEAGEHMRSHWIKALLAGPPICKPGESWNYSSAGYILLGEVIRRVSGMPYEDYVKQTIIEPLGLSRTFFQVPEHLHDEVCTVNDGEITRLKDRTDRTYLAPRAAGGLYSSLADLQRFGQMLLGRGTLDGVRIISRKSVELLASDQFPNGISTYHWGDKLIDFHSGLGVQHGCKYDSHKETTIGHEGVGRSALMIDMQEGLVSAVFVPSIQDWVPVSVYGVNNIIWSGLQ